MARSISSHNCIFALKLQLNHLHLDTIFSHVNEQVDFCNPSTITYVLYYYFSQLFSIKGQNSDMKGMCMLSLTKILLNPFALHI